MITPELVGLCLQKLAVGKACGPDNVSVKHILYAYPCFVLALCILFRTIFINHCVPTAFGVGTIFLLVKDKSKNFNDIDNYRPIALIPVISKIFEHVILCLCKERLSSDELQFGFKRGLGCNEAFYALRTTVSHFTSAGSTVYLAALDINFKEAFDSVHHDKLFDSLVSSGVPYGIVNILRHWYSILCVNVKWGSRCSQFFAVFNGVRQGSVLSPTIFNVFINVFIVRLRHLSFGCHLRSMFIGCLLYADDLLLICPSVRGLQTMLDVCFFTADSVCLFSMLINHIVWQ